MPILTSGSNVTLSVAAGQVLTVQSDQATFDFENPVGTRVGEFASDMTFGPFSAAGSVKITSVQGSLFYDLASPVAGGTMPYNPANVAITGGTIGPNLRRATTVQSYAGAGDSLMAGTTNGASIFYQSVRANSAVLGQNVGQFAVGGKTAAQILTEQIPSAIASGASRIIVNGGTNDLLTNVTQADTRARMMAIFAAAQSAGVTPIDMGMAPNNTPASAISFAAHEAWRRLYCCQNNIVHADIWTALATYAGAYQAGLFTDTTHPNTAGAVAAAARVIAAANGTTLAKPLIALTDTGSDFGSPIDNALTFAGAGTVPTGWTVYGSSGSPVYSVQSAAAGEWGNWMRCALTGAVSSTGMFYQKSLASAGFNIGDKIAVAMRMRWVDTGQALTVNAQVFAPVYTNTSPGVHPLVAEKGGVSGNDMYLYWTGTISSGTTFDLHVYGTGTGYFEIQAPAAINLTALGLA